MNYLWTNYELSYEELLHLTDEISPRQQCLNSLMTEVYECLNGISLGTMNDVFTVSKLQI